MRRDGEREAMEADDEDLRLRYESCPGCGEDLGSEARELERCPSCDEEL